MKLVLQFLLVISVLDLNIGFTLKKCCSPAERYNIKTGRCVPIKKSLEFKINMMVLTYNNLRWVPKDEKFFAIYNQKMELCDGFLTDDPNYRVTENGTLVKYTGQNQTYYQLYNDFCLDTNYETGEQVVIICNNQKIIRKCCNETMELLEANKGIYQCNSTENAVFLNDLSDILWKTEETKPNLEYDSNQQISNFTNYFKISDFKLEDFTFDENQTIQFKSASDFCLDKLNGKWILLAEKEMVSVQSANIATTPVSLVSLISMILIFGTILMNRETWISKKLVIFSLWIYTICLLLALLFEAISSFFAFLVLPKILLFTGSSLILPAILFSKLFHGVDKFYKASLWTLYGLISFISTVLITLSYNMDNFLGKIFSYLV